MGAWFGRCGYDECSNGQSDFVMSSFSCPCTKPEDIDDYPSQLVESLQRRRTSDRIGMSKAVNITKATQLKLDELPMCPMVGCSYAFLHAFSEIWGSDVLEPSSDRRVAQLQTPSASSTQPANSGLLRKSMTMGEICQAVIKPHTKAERNSTGNLVASREPAASGIGDQSGSDRPYEFQRNLETITSRFRKSAEEGTNLSYAELCMEAALLDPRGKPAFKRATHFVSHAWQYDFVGFVAAIGAWIMDAMENLGVSEDDTYFWVDAFVVNQHQTQSYPQEWWSTRFMQAVGEIGSTILVIEPWSDPVPLKRAWVIWELYCTTVTGARLQFTMRPQSTSSFQEALVDSFEKVQTVLSRVDVSKSEAFHESDRDMIHSEISRSIGFTKMNELVQTRLLQWLQSAAKSRLGSMNTDNETKKKSQAGVDIKLMKSQQGGEAKEDRLKLQHNLAMMLREYGNPAEGEIMFRELLLELEETHGSDHVSVMSCMNQLAVTLQKQKKEEEALKMHRVCLARRRKVLGNEHEDTLQSASNLAVILSQKKPMTQEDFDEARNLYKMAIEGREHTVGADHPRTLYTVTNLARLLSEAPLPTRALFDEAEQLHLRAVSKLSSNLSPVHPLTLGSLHNQAIHRSLLAKFLQKTGNSADALKADALTTQAIETLQTVVQHRTEKLGKEHHDTIAASRALLQLKSDKRGRNRSDGNIDAFAEYESFKDYTLAEYSDVSTANAFRRARRELREYGVQKLLDELIDTGYVDPVTLRLTTGLQPYNTYARVASGVVVQNHMLGDQLKLGELRDEYIVVSNRTEDDEMWQSTDPTWRGKASMSKRHRLVSVKDLHWEWFNVLTFGVEAGAIEAISRLEQMKDAALRYVRNTEGWSADKVGLFFHVYAHCSMPSLHLHIVDLEHTGPTFEALQSKNLPLEEVLMVLREEAAGTKADKSGPTVSQTLSMNSP